MRNSFWTGKSQETDSYSLFRGIFSLSESGLVKIQVTGAMWYQAWLDAGWLSEGPFRYSLDAPEYQTIEIELSAGVHVLAFHAHNEGVETRILKATPPFIWCAIRGGEQEIPVTWKGLALDSQDSGMRRLNPQLGWVECRDTRLEPLQWEQPGFDASGWEPPSFEASSLPEPVAVKLANVKTFIHELTLTAEGPLASTFGYLRDEPAYLFFARDRVCRELPAKGLWRQYDLGRVRLGRAAITLNVPAGTIIEIGYAEALTDGRVAPFINLSGGPSCNLDRFVARGGEQIFLPLTPNAGATVTSGLGVRHGSFPVICWDCILASISAWALTTFSLSPGRCPKPQAVCRTRTVAGLVLHGNAREAVSRIPALPGVPFACGFPMGKPRTSKVARKPLGKSFHNTSYSCPHSTNTQPLRLSIRIPFATPDPNFAAHLSGVGTITSTAPACCASSKRSPRWVLAA